MEIDPIASLGKLLTASLWIGHHHIDVVHLRDER
jgi:hypothetical protein